MNPRFEPAGFAITLAFAARATVTLGLTGSLLAGCSWGDDPPVPNTLPTGITQIGVTVYGATTTSSGTTAATQDLLTAGLGRTGIGAAAPPAYADASNPTAAAKSG